MIDASVIVCTYNRIDLLRHCLAALLDQTYPKDRYEILIMENNCTDGTIELVNSLAWNQRQPQLRLYHVAQQGLSYARNERTQQARGRLILYIDDDAVASRDWVSSIVKAFEDPSVCALGGQVTLKFLVPRPRWLSKRNGLLAHFSPKHDRPYRVTKSPLPIGCNMAFRAKVLKELGGFNTALGRRKRELTSGEDHDLFRRLLAKGGIVLVDPAIRVEHLVDQSKLTKEYFIKSSYYGGLCKVARLGSISPARRWWVLGTYILDAAIDVGIWLAILAATFSPDRAFDRQLHVVRAFSKIKALKEQIGSRQ